MQIDFADEIKGYRSWDEEIILGYLSEPNVIVWAFNSGEHFPAKGRERCSSRQTMERLQVSERLNLLLLALKTEEGDHEPRTEGSF